MQNLTVLLGEGALAAHQADRRRAVYMRYILMGLILLLVLRFAPRGLLPERTPGGATDAGAGGKRATAA
jgi:branched-chain amino acid transport system permease protein